jgi:dihydrodiol dehydrogenase / D-xylose 1-dehydrogenase (NADP)
MTSRCRHGEDCSPTRSTARARVYPIGNIRTEATRAWKIYCLLTPLVDDIHSFIASLEGSSSAQLLFRNLDSLTAEQDINMSAKAPYTVRWGILATGGIAQTFTKDLLVSPTTRGANDIKHTVVAAASSSSATRAKEFLKEVGASADARAYGTYRELVEDAEVDIVYIATPHSHHYQHAMLALEAGKHILCEKAFTVNAAQAKKLVDLAKSKNLFLMEAVWTRYFPLSAYVRDVITSGKVGALQRVFADNSIAIKLEDVPESNRMIDPALAGGALLDSGIYSLTWVFQTIWTTTPEAKRKRPEVVSFIKKLPRSGVDEMTSMLLTFPRDPADGGDVHAIATTSIRISNNPASLAKQEDKIGPNIRIQGSRGEIQVFPPAFRPTRTRVIDYESGHVEDKSWPQPGPGTGSGWYNGFGAGKNSEGEGHGMFWEADEAARAVRDGRLEGALEGWGESVLIMEIMDEARKKAGLVYPEKIETLDYPVELN